MEHAKKKFRTFFKHSLKILVLLFLMFVVVPPLVSSDDWLIFSSVGLILLGLIYYGGFILIDIIEEINKTSKQ